MQTGFSSSSTETPRPNSWANTIMVLSYSELGAVWHHEVLNI